MTFRSSMCFVFATSLATIVFYSARRSPCGPRLDDRGGGSAAIHVEHTHGTLPELNHAAPDPAIGAESRLRSALARSVDEFLTELTELGQLHPALSLELARKLARSDEEKVDWVSLRMSAWAQAEPIAAWGWLLQRPGEMDDWANGTLPSVVLGEMASADPSLLLSTVEAQLRPENREGPFAAELIAHSGVAALIGGGHLDLATNALERWTADPVRPPLGSSPYVAAADALRKKDLAAASSWLLTLPASAQREDTIVGFAAAWAVDDPSMALQWTRTLADSKERRRAVERVWSEWAESDSLAASEWLAQHADRLPPAETEKKVALLLHSSYALRDNPPAALQWVSLLTDPKLRRVWHEKILLRWSDRDWPSAAAFIQGAPDLSPVQKQQLLQQAAAGLHGQLRFDD